MPSDTLLALMDLSVGQVFNTNTFRQDVLKINNYYERIGYGGQVPTHVKDINLDPTTGAVTLTILEGLTVKHIIIGGDPLLPPQLLLPVMTLKPGMQYSDDIRDADFKALQKFYEDKWHLEVGNFEGGIDPSSIDQKADTVDIKYNIYVARVAVVEITGNVRTKDQVIRRELRVKPGMVLNTDAIKNDYERLNSMGFFSKVEPDIKDGPDPKKPQQVTLAVARHRTAHGLGFGRVRVLGRFDRTGSVRHARLHRQQPARYGQHRVAPVRKGRAHRRRAAVAGRTVSRQHAAVAKIQRQRQHFHEQLDVLLSGLRHHEQYPDHSVDHRTPAGNPGDAVADGKRHAARQRRSQPANRVRPA